MAEPTLTISYAGFKVEVGYFLGLGYDENAWSAPDAQNIRGIIRQAYRQFLYPPLQPGESKQHVWSFLRRAGVLNAWPNLAGTVSGSPTYDADTGLSTVTVTAAKFVDSVTSHNLKFGTSGTSYAIKTFVSTTQVKVTGDASGEAAGQAYTVTANGNYDLPDAFGSLDGPITFQPGDLYTDLLIVGEGEIRRRRVVDTTATIPVYAAIRPKSSDGSTGQRFELLIWPTPDASYTLDYAYYLNPDDLTDANPYPLGGNAYGECLLASCLAVAEQKSHDAVAQHTMRFKELLAAAIARDKSSQRPNVYGSLNPTVSEGRIVRHASWLPANVVVATI